MANEIQNDVEVPEESTELDQLTEEGEDLTPDEPEAEEPEEDETPNEEPDPLEARLSALEESLAEKDRKIAFLEGRLERGGQEEVPKEPTLDIDEEELARLLTDKDPKVGVRAIRQLVDKVADFKLQLERQQTQSIVRDSDAVRSAKESDRARVMADFADDMDDPAFLQQLEQVFRTSQRASGGRYLPNSLYSAAAMVKVTRDRVSAQKRGTRNGVTEVRANRNPQQTTVSTAADYTKAASIDDLPASEFSPREKAQMKAAAKRMGVSEKSWIANLER